MIALFLFLFFLHPPFVVGDDRAGAFQFALRRVRPIEEGLGRAHPRGDGRETPVDDVAEGELIARLEGRIGGVIEQKSAFRASAIGMRAAESRRIQHALAFGVAIPAPGHIQGKAARAAATPIWFFCHGCSYAGRICLFAGSALPPAQSGIESPSRFISATSRARCSSTSR